MQMNKETEKKPDYTDMDWSGLIKDRIGKWEAMLGEVKEAGWETVPLRTSQGFTSQLILLPVQAAEAGQGVCAEKAGRGTLIVCAGGGFMFKSANEAKPVAEFFHKAGMNAAILDYHVNAGKGLGADMDTQREAGLDGLEAVRYLRVHAKELGILPDKIGIGGFSAGGMVTSMAATQFDYGDPQAADPQAQVSSRPDAALILYGAMSNSGVGGGVGSYCCEEQAERCKFDAIRNIRSDCPPMFVFQTHKDDPRHALQFCYELASRGVPYEIHTFEEGPHGGGLYDGACEDSPSFPHTSRWAELAAEWLVGKGF